MRSHKDSPKREARMRAGANGLKSLPTDIHTMLSREQQHWRHGSMWETMTLAAFYGCIVLSNLRDKAAELTNKPEQLGT
jgi:hypothetical protein